MHLAFQAIFTEHLHKMWRQSSILIIPEDSSFWPFLLCATFIVKEELGPQDLHGLNKDIAVQNN